MNWSPEIFKIEEVRIQKNQPVLYKLLSGPERRFVREELMKVVNPELPPERIMQS